LPEQSASGIEPVVSDGVDVAQIALEIADLVLAELVATMLQLQIGHQGQRTEHGVAFVGVERPGGLVAAVIVVFQTTRQVIGRETLDQHHVTPVVASKSVSIATDDQPATVVLPQ